jgi:hypothetical protein
MKNAYNNDTISFRINARDREKRFYDIDKHSIFLEAVSVTKKKRFMTLTNTLAFLRQ